MSYTPPAGNAVVLESLSGYSAPSGSAVVLDCFKIDTQYFPSALDGGASVFGNPTVQWSVFITGAGNIGSGEAFGTPTVTFFAMGGAGVLKLHVENSITQLTSIWW